MIYSKKGFRSFHTGDIGSVVQRASKILTVVVGGLKKKSATFAITAEVCASVSAQFDKADIILKVLRMNQLFFKSMPVKCNLKCLNLCMSEWTRENLPYFRKFIFKNVSEISSAFCTEFNFMRLRMRPNKSRKSSSSA